jgi:hypothetical protein
VRDRVADLLARPFPDAIDGALASVVYDTATRTLTIGIEGAGESPHRITAPGRTWPSAP